MKKIQAQNYVIANARYNKYSPEKPYWVGYPTVNSSMRFFSSDTEELVDVVFAFGKTYLGRKMWNERYSKGDYLIDESETDGEYDE